MISPRIIAKYEQALDAWLDAEAEKHRYDNRITFALRAGYPNPWQAQALQFAQWMDATNYEAYALISEVQSGAVDPMSVEDFIARFPPFEVTGDVS